MRNLKKKELMNCIDTLLKANGKVLKINSEGRVDFLTQCQEMAIMVGTEIDKMEGEDIITVSYLEQYCEEIYLMSVATDRGDLIQAQKRGQALLHQIKDSIRTDIPDSPAEVIFLPYKASMWDALDSVYRAAVADGTCNVTVVPIPYYNINPNGEVLAVEYEGNLFPADIPVADFRKIDLAKLHPDVIFIHNPYDEWNKVTQVPVEYFSSTLVNYTEHLAYIPYFVTKGDTIKDDYCYMPAVRNAWRTFVQSDAVRDCYIKNGADPKKIVAMGSPKFDMVLQMQENPPALPREWETALSGRKIFLLNTHLNPIINEAEKTIDKLQQIFQLFRERDDVALLWRPHPLSIQTAKSMNPKIVDEYVQLIEEFKILSNGVYDDSADIHRAIALSDAYIGHWSSVIALYGFTGKPIYVLNVKEVNRVDESVTISSVVEVEGYWWGVADDKNALFKVNPQTREAWFVTTFEKEAAGSLKLYREVIAFRNKLFFVPYTAQHIAEYDMDKDVMKYYAVPVEMQKDFYKFGNCTVKDNKLYMFPIQIKSFVCLDMENGELHTCNWDKTIIPEEIRTDNKKINMFIRAVRVEDEVYLLCQWYNAFVKVELDGLHCELIRMPGVEEKIFSGVALYQNIMYVLSPAGNVYAYDRINNTVEMFYEHDKQSEEEEYWNILCYDGKLWIMAGENGYYHVIDIQTKKIKQCRGKQVGYEVKDTAVKIVSDKKWIDYKLGDNRNVYREQYISVETFVDDIVSVGDEYVSERQAYFRGLQAEADGYSGEKIWKYVKERR